MTGAPRLDGRAPVADVVAHIDATSPPNEALAALLCERHAVYAGRGSGETERLRANILARLAPLAPSSAAIPFVVEELETGDRAASVAAAARAIHGAREFATDLVPHLLASVRRFRDADEVVRLEGRAGSGAATTVLTDLFRAIASFGNAAAAALPELRDLRHSTTLAPAVVGEIEAAVSAITSDASPAPRSCCKSAAPTPGRPLAPPSAREDPIELEDQDGNLVDLAELFAARPGFVAFFYTRCMNPEKCSLTITKLARLRRRLVELGWDDLATLAAITYDPDFDRPSRLRSYGEARGLAFGPRCRLLRTTGAFETLRDRFALGVGYGPATVNQHRLECAVLDRRGQIMKGIVRRQWSEDEILAALQVQIDARAMAG